ncbi:hypothetical protein DESC_810077 [Desulfosarcina cetonica]|nr:hypothetical protein DESC_810077 [Desulfosarcina cetonica]
MVQVVKHIACLLISLHLDCQPTFMIEKEGEILRCSSNVVLFPTSGIGYGNILASDICLAQSKIYNYLMLIYINIK